ncbi:VanZ family protein [Povalibacter uvarum]|uniref:VanZ family protein n=1 Tax=Povalibacter uvarum TaxID=732238 RepID=A0A841HGP4_9GAMM|nr:VanZ family protein [Povalibacter uvarum]MBB6092301.1 VanZ family protein [Povalibacter uvarum]
MLPVRHPRWWLVFGWAWIIIAIVVCLLPGKNLPVTHVSDKIEHAALYAFLMIWFAGLYPRSRYTLIAVALLLLGVAIELAQGAMHLGRTADVRDVIANSIGVGIGLTLSLLGLGGWAQWIDGWARGRAATTSD